MVASLAEKLKTQPNNVEGWNMLARSYNAMGKYSDAVQAYAHLIQIEPKNADYLVSYADTLAVTHNKDLQGEPETLIKRALELDPQNVRALSLAGSAAFDRQDYADAVAYWKDIIKLVSPDSEMARTTLSSIGEAQSLMDGRVAAPGASLSGHASVLVGARISKSGNATPQPGDVESSLSTADVRSPPVSLTLNALHK